MKSRFWKSE
jgi:hypothetical protein